MRLASPILAKQFYTMLLSTRLVHELELSLDWNTSFEDLRILKGVMQQSNVFHLGLNLCGKTGPTSDFVYRNRRAEPIVQIMASGKMHTMSLRGTISFLSQTKDPLKTATLHVRHLNLDENVTSLDDFSKLEKLIRASPMLVQLRVMVGSIDQAFSQLRTLVTQHKTLSILVLQLQDGTAASVQFESGSGQIATIDLKVMEPGSIELMKMPMVTSVELLDKTSAVRCSKHIQTLIEQYPSLLTVKIAHLPDGGLDGLRALQQAVDEYPPDSDVEEVFDGRESSSESKGQVAVAPLSVERLKPESGFTRLGSAHRRSLLWELTLLVASFDEENMPEETLKDAMVVPDNISHTRRSAFIIRRRNGSLALIRLELEDNPSNSAVLHVGDFGASKASMHTPTKTLTVMGRWSVDRLMEITKYSTTHLFNLRTLEIGYLSVELLDILSLAQVLTTRCQALTRLHIRDMDDKIMRRFNLPLQDLDLTNDHITSKRHPSLMHLLQTATTLSRITLSVSSISETFGVVNSAAQLHKQLSYTQLDEGTSRFSVQFIIGTGTVESAALRVHEGELSHHLPLGTVTDLNLGSPADLSRLKEIADSLFDHCLRLTTLKLDYICGGLLGVIDIMTQATSSRTSRYRLVLAEVDESATCRTERVFDLPLHTLDMVSQYINEKDLGVLKHLLRTNPALQELYLSVTSINVSQEIFDFIVQERRSITVSMCLLSGLTGVFSLEAGTEDGALTVTQKIAQPELNETFFLPSARLQRVDVVGTSISKSHAGEIAAFILRHYCGVGSIRFTDLPNEVQDVAIIIKESIQHGLSLRDLDNPESRTLDSYEVDPTNSVHKQVNLAVLSVRSDDTQNDLPPSATEGEYFFSIARSRQDGTLEVVELDCTDPDGVTLRLNPVAFDKSDIAQLSRVTYLRVSIGQGSTLIEDMILTPVKAFSNLRQLELLLESSWHLSILLLLTSAENRHPTLEQVKIWHPDLTTQPIVHDLPFKTLNLTWCTTSMANFSVVENIIVACPSLAQIALKVPLTATAFKLLSSIVKAHGSIAQLHLHDDEGTFLSVSFEPLTGEIIAISVEFVGTWKSLAQDDSPVLALMHLPVSILYLVGVIQEATINNPGLRCLLLKDMNVNICLDLDIPIKTIDLSERLMSQYDVESLQRLLLVCPLLAGLHMTVPSVNDLKAAYWSIGSISSSLKTLAECRLKIHNGAEALVRYSDEDGSVISVELRISDELDDELRTLPMIKRVTIQPEDSSLWHDSGFAAEKLRSIARHYPVMTTLEIECDIGSPLPALLFLRFAVQVGLLPSSFRFRHWLTEDNHTLITHDLPLQKLDLGEFIVSHEVISALGRFVHGCSHLREMAIGVINSSTLDAAYDRFGRLIEGFGQLRVLKLRLNDGYAIKLWRNVSYENSVFSQTDPTPEAAALQVSGLVWPASFYRPITTKLTILPKSPTDGDDSDDSSRIHRIASKAKRDLFHLNHLVLTCPIDQFFQYLPSFASPSQAIITRLDLQTFNKARTIISIRFWILPRAIVHLDNITDEDLLDNFGALFSEYFLRVEVVQHEGKPPVIDVSMKGLDQDEGSILEEVLWDTRDVPACRVFSLLDKMSSRRRADVPRLFQFVWKTIQKATDARPHPREILDDSETATTLAKLLVRRATGFDLEYEAMEVLIPFVITEIERENSAEWDKPFWALQSYTIGVLQGSTEREKILEFKNLIPRFVSCTIHDVYDCVDEYDSTSVSEGLAYSSDLEDDDRPRDRRDV
ncbi:hypothetical protein BGX24_000457 [Mortierella sp. AD032]|nr:hypothetical protein BGX24_000457 [Mortierella sp. AD032]